MAALQVSSIQLQYENQPQRRRIRVNFNNKSHGYISPCHESYENWHATFEEKQLMVDIAERHNAWLHGE